MCQILIVYCPFTVHNPSTLQSDSILLTSANRNIWSEGEGWTENWNDHICPLFSSLLADCIISGSLYIFRFNEAKPDIFQKRYSLKANKSMLVRISSELIDILITICNFSVAYVKINLFAYQVDPLF